MQRHIGIGARPSRPQHVRLGNTLGLSCDFADLPTRCGLEGRAPEQSAAVVLVTDLLRFTGEVKRNRASDSRLQ